MANPGLAFVVGKLLSFRLASLSDANQWLPLLYYKKVVFGKQSEYHVVIGSAVSESGHFS